MMSFKTRLCEKGLELSQNLTSSIDYTKRLLYDLGRLLILIILDVIPVVNLTVLGYFCRVIRVPRDSMELPPLRSFIDLWVQGLKVVAVAFIYLIIPFVLMAPFIALTALTWMGFPGLLGFSVPLAVFMLIIGLILAFL